MGFTIRRTHLSTKLSLVKAQRLDKASGFVETDNSGRSNIFSTGEKALYSYSPTAEEAAKQGLGGLAGLAILSVIAIFVVFATFGSGINEGPTNASKIDLINLNRLSEISSS